MSHAQCPRAQDLCSDAVGLDLVLKAHDRPRVQFWQRPEVLLNLALTLTDLFVFSLKVWPWPGERIDHGELCWLNDRPSAVVALHVTPSPALWDRHHAHGAKCRAGLRLRERRCKPITWLPRLCGQYGVVQLALGTITRGCEEEPPMCEVYVILLTATIGKLTSPYGANTRTATEPPCPGALPNNRLHIDVRRSCISIGVADSDVLLPDCPSYAKGW
mmetsp:Transcript_62663/g.183286  ORF Transcript_62663/g.183286 Transcript_62663/m.183286 type:complete len:217 (-) Transcript_62663:176-826(-)